MPSAVDFEAEFKEAFDAILHSADPGESVIKRLSTALKESLDVVGHAVDALDPQDRAQELPALKLALMTAAEKAVQSMNLRGLAARLVANAIPSLIPQAVDAIADKSSPAAEVRDKYILPALDATAIYLLEIRKSVAPDAPALVFNP